MTQRGKPPPKKSAAKIAAERRKRITRDRSDPDRLSKRAVKK